MKISLIYSKRLFDEAFGVLLEPKLILIYYVLVFLPIDDARLD